MAEERIFEKAIFNCNGCDHCKTKMFTKYNEKKEHNPHGQPSGRCKTYFYAYCNKESKFIIPATEYTSTFVSNPIKFPDFCPLRTKDEKMNLKEICQWFIETYPEEDDSVGGTLSDIIDIRNKLFDVLEYLERG